MDIQRKAFESSNNVNPDWSFKFDEELQQYVATDFEMTNQVDEFNEHWDTFRAGWEAAKAQAVQEGFVLVSAEQISQWGHMANCAEEYGCPECYEARGYAHSLACEINAYFNVSDAQEQKG